MFPLSASGNVRIRKDGAGTREALVKEIASRLDACKPSALTVDVHAISFHAGPLRFVWNTNLLVPISRGTIEVSENRTKAIASYKLSFNEMLIAGTLISFFLAYAPPHSSGRPLVFVGFWFFFVGGNYLLSIVRFRAMLQDAGRAAKRGTSKQAARHTAS